MIARKLKGKSHSFIEHANTKIFTSVCGAYWHIYLESANLRTASKVECRRCLSILAKQQAEEKKV